MITTQVIKCRIPEQQADNLNRESGRIYTAVMVEHWRIYRRKGVWLKQSQAEKLNDLYDADAPNLLHAHSRDAAQQGFYKACKTARTLRREGNAEVRYPYRRRRFRTTVWKDTGIRLRNGCLLLSLARGFEPVVIPLPPRFTYLPEEAFREVRLVYNHKRKKYQWHLVIDDGQEPPEAPGDHVVSVDLGEIHPAVASDHSQAVVFSARELRAVIQYRNKTLAEITRLQSRCKKKSRRWWRLQRLKNEIRAYCERKIRDILHKVSRAVVDWAIERKARFIIIGDVRDAGNGKRLARKSQQKISQWPHGKLRRYITYKAAMAGITVLLQNEAYTSQTCPNLECGHQHKPKGRDFKCPKCGLRAHRDVVGAANILSKYLYGLIGGICPQDVRFVQPFKIEREKYRGRSKHPFLSRMPVSFHTVVLNRLRR